MATRYDADSAAMFAPEALEPAVEKLAELAAGRPALELAIGTGRVGLPLAGRGVAVSGIELSEAMVAALRAKPGAGAIPVASGPIKAKTMTACAIASAIWSRAVRSTLPRLSQAW